MVKRKKVAVAPVAELHARRRLFSLLSELYPVDFAVWQSGSGAAWDGAILWEGCPEQSEITTAMTSELLVIARGAGQFIPAQRRTAEFGSATSLDACFRGQRMVDECIKEFPALRLGDGDELVCAFEAQPFWVVRRMAQATATVVALGPEELTEKQTVYDVFNRRRWLRLLPCLNYLKRITASEAWQSPPIQACLMFDDPNLHRPRYGFLDFRKLAKHAREFNYHVSFAMVPLDAWGTNRVAGDLFKKNAAWLSLCMHGNDHAGAELASSLDKDGFTRLFAQALRRVERFEQRSGVPVSRVMVPPHGAFHEAAADPMMNLGYEAVCVSRASLTAWNKGKAWPRSFGHSVTEFLGGGLPVIPRQVLAPGHEGTYRLATFLGQPIIPHAHHQDCEEGHDLLANAAKSINGLGKVVWTDMTSISRSNYLFRRDGERLNVKMLSRRITLPMGECAKEIVVERPWISAGMGEELLVLKRDGQQCFSRVSGGQSTEISLPRGGVLELISPPLRAVDFMDVAPPPVRIWSVGRRLLSETRDRISPLMSAIRRKRAECPEVSTLSQGSVKIGN